MVLLISLLAKSKYFFLAGLAPLFPTFALFAHIFSYQNGGEAALKEVAFFGLLSIIPYIVYLIGVIVFIRHMGLVATLCLSLFFWSISAFSISYVWQNTNLKEYANIQRNS